MPGDQFFPMINYVYKNTPICGSVSHPHQNTATLLLVENVIVKNPCLLNHLRDGFTNSLRIFFMSFEC